MKRRLSFLLLAAPLCAALAQTAPSVDDLVAKHIAAVGGADKLKAIKTAKITATTSMGGMELTTTVYVKRPALARSETSVQGNNIVQVFDGKQSWSINPFMGSEPSYASEDESNQAREEAESQIDGHLVDYKAKGSTIELQGKEDVEGSPAYKLKITTKSGNVIYDYLDAETYLETKRVATIKRMGQQVEATTLFTNFKPVAGVLMPHQMDQSANTPQGAVNIKTTMQKIEVNVPIDDAIFQMPAKPDAKKQ